MKTAWRRISPAGVARRHSSSLLRQLAIVALALAANASHAQPLTPSDVATAFVAQVDRRLQIPEEELRLYAALVEAALHAAGVPVAQSQWLLAVDRSHWVQAASRPRASSLVLHPAATPANVRLH